MRKPPAPYPISLTVRWNGLVNVLQTDCIITNPYSPTPLAGLKCLAIWDTGASASVISQRVIDALALPAFGIVTVRAAGGEHRTTQHVVGIALPNGLHFSPTPVTRGMFEGFDVLIGMDILSRGSFAVTNMGGKTIMLFSCPSHGFIDFVQMYPPLKPKGNPQSYKKNHK